jgi:Transposase DDE domain
MLPRGGEPRTNAQRLALEARARTKSERGLWAYQRRMADAEGVIAELKTLHALDRARRRGRPAFQVQLLVGSAALNLKRLATHAPTAQEGAAAATKAAGAEPTADHRRAAIRKRQRLTRKSDSHLAWTVSLCLN